MSKKTGRPATVDIQKSVYTLASVDGESAELTMYGDIYESQPVDFWTGKPVEGQFILLSDFLADLEQIAGCKSLTIRMNSYGGDAGVSNTIHNRLRELARDGMKVSYHVRLRYGAGQPVQPCDDPQVLDLFVGRLQCRRAAGIGKQKRCLG